MNYGILVVDFAGTPEEAREFVKDKPALKVGKFPNVGNEGLPALTAMYTSAQMKLEKLSILESLGWDRGSVIDKPYNYAPRRKTRTAA